jgi:4-alpha-glucanotransferase
MKAPPTIRTRASGVLIHPTSIPGPGGCGDLGPEAHRFAETLAAAGQSWWLMLPIGPPGFGNSPYCTFSSFAGNPLLISLETLAQDGLLKEVETASWPTDRVPFDDVIAFKERHLRRAYEAFQGTRRPAGYDGFLRRADSWLPPYALYQALKNARKDLPWTRWDGDLRAGKAAALQRARKELAAEVGYQAFLQYEFDRQWESLRARCRGLGLGLLGDVPFYVPLDSADVWARQDQFDVGPAGKPRRVVGVPPDDFAKEGQLWGFPLYLWDRMKKDGFAWWLSRLRAALSRFDAIRIDHFLGFHRAWAVSTRHRNALKGKWIPGPGGEILERLAADGRPLEFVAEDLGSVTPEALELRDRFDLPGIRVIQFGFGWDPEQYHLPHNYPKRSLAATSTHDNDTARGWFSTIEHPGTKEWVQRYLKTDGHEIHWTLTQAVWNSPADTAIVPAQDIPGLGSEARMNRPGVPTGNWDWRLRPGLLTPELMGRLRDLTQSSGRLRL